MSTGKWNGALLALTVAATTAMAAPASAEAYALYRGVTATLPAGTVSWVAANFGVSGSPPMLTFFHFASDDAARLAMPSAQCIVKVDIGAVVNPALGATAQIGDSDIQVNAARVDQPLAFPWTATFDNNPAGHWAIAKTVLVSPTSNAAASRVAAAGFMSLATAPGSGVTVINGLYPNCTVD